LKRRKVKFLILLFLSLLLFVPFVIFSAMFRLIPYVLSFSFGLVIYCTLLYRHVYKGKKPKYPLVPPEGRTDIYFPRTDIPRPIYEDVRRYPEYFESKRKKRKKK